MEKALLELGTTKPHFFEIGSSEKLPKHFLRQVVKECYFRKLSNPNGTFTINLPSQDLKVTYHTKGLHTNAFVSGTESFDVIESLMSFSNFLRENKITPYNVKISAQIIGDNPEQIFADISGNVKVFGKLLSSEYGTSIELKPEVSYSGDEYKAEFSAPLSTGAIRKLERWARDNGYSLDMEKAPLEEKKR